MRSHARTEAPVVPASPRPGGQGHIHQHHGCHGRQQHPCGGEEGPKGPVNEDVVARRPRHRGRRYGRVGVICCEDAGINSRICTFVAAASIRVPLGGAGRSCKERGVAASGIGAVRIAIGSPVDLGTAVFEPKVASARLVGLGPCAG